jgi:hypothetical protein
MNKLFAWGARFSSSQFTTSVRMLPYFNFRARNLFLKGLGNIFSNGEENQKHCG